jgi:phosphocarrier protein
MKTLNLTITDPVGLHARPATILVQEASKFSSAITLVYGERRIDMKSILGIMGAGVPTQAQITMEAAGADQDAAIVAIHEVVIAQKLAE